MDKPRVRPVGATAVATITVRISDLGSWGPDCSVQQVHDQATRAAVGAIRNMDKERRLTIIGTPEIKTITTERT
jgi:hypothetical protein